MEPTSNYIKDIHKLFKNARIKVYPKNQLIHYQGDPLTHVYLLRKGYIKAYTILDSGDTRTILILGKNDLFPLSFSLSLDWEDYKTLYFYQTLTEVELHVMPIAELKATIDSNSEMLKIYMNYLAASNQIMMNQLEVMKNKKAIDKVTMLLPYLVSKSGRQVKPGVYELGLRLSHQELADLSGVTRETTTTLIKQLEEEGIIDQHKGKWLIYIDNLEKVLASR